MKGYSSDAAIQSRYLLKGLGMLGCEAINLAIKDFSSGGEYLQKVQKELDVPLISANINFTESQKPFTRPFMLKKLTARQRSGLPFSKLTVGIFGLCDEKENLLNRNLPEAQLISTDPVAAARATVSDLKKDAELIILLFNGRYKTCEAILQAVPGIDVVVVGGEYYKVMPNSESKPIMVSTPSLGKYFGRLNLTLNAKKEIVNHEITRVTLDEKIPDDPQMVKLVADFEKEQRNAGTASSPQH
ncbi:MAG: hypothetical protein EHM72_02895 [Calditrichaeota bacterium]|nr:MAG: hypothetical protein EHM72_02895 [Calditrichota bacterium]